ncbi:hypothetical protein ACFWQ6_23500 [Streptomyces coelicoflavus]|nr:MULTISPECIES: hypothetical protein [Streptomyces]KAF2777773.1 hypothetical protein STPH1_2434 [Streptomyces sp. OM5714]MCX5035572.1 hypothetical protein [Streptomyces coelicoflavus]MDI6517575.1 hypothetical protein [Streptomyces coelicoflavus]NHI07382.1 hypothetical protein [Streptomyces sp. KO7888]
MQDNTRGTQDDERAFPVVTEPEGQTELIEIRMLDKIETIDSKAVAR